MGLGLRRVPLRMFRCLTACGSFWSGARRRGPFFDDYRTKVSARRVAGLGDQADHDGFASLSVLKGDAYLRLAVIGVPDALGAEKRLAAQALPSM